MGVVIIVQEVDEALAVDGDLAQSEVLLGVTEVALPGIEDLPYLGVLVLEHGQRRALVHSLVVVDDDPLLQQGKAHRLPNLLQQVRSTTGRYLKRIITPAERKE